VRGNGQGYDVIACASGRAAVRIFSDPKTRLGTANVTRDGVDKAISTIYTQSGSVRSYISSDGLALAVDLNETVAPDDTHLAAQFSDASFSDKLQCLYTPPIAGVTPEVPEPPMISIYRFYYPGVPQHFFTDDRAAGLATGAVYEGTPFRILSQAGPETVALRRCVLDPVTNPTSAGGDLLSVDPNCEGGQEIAVLGYVYASAYGNASNRGRPLTRCKQATALEYIQVLPTGIGECTTNGWAIDAELGFAVP
jgi:hypothetical protein